VNGDFRACANVRCFNVWVQHNEEIEPQRSRKTTDQQLRWWREKLAVKRGKCEQFAFLPFDCMSGI
jgi:hypothetical protein